MHKPLLVSIVGPTAVGKTGVGVQLAKELNCSVISADSRQVFKQMSIGTAKPEETEMQGVPHHCVNHIDIQEDYSAGHFEKEVINLLPKLFEQNKTQLMVGGSGLYVKAVNEGLDKFPEVSKELRAEITELSLEQMKERLKELDPNSYATIALDNRQRLSRALEISISSGRPYSSFLNQEKPNRPFSTLKIGLFLGREEVYERINLRVDQMMEEGLLEEVQALLPHKNLNALNTVGYKELFQYLDGQCSLDFAVQKIKQHTRNFAKRQMTWFRADEDIKWFAPTDLEEILREIKKAEQ